MCQYVTKTMRLCRVISYNVTCHVTCHISSFPNRTKLQTKQKLHTTLVRHRYSETKLRRCTVTTVQKCHMPRTLHATHEKWFSPLDQVVSFTKSFFANFQHLKIPSNHVPHVYQIGKSNLFHNLDFDVRLICFDMNWFEMGYWYWQYWYYHYHTILQFLWLCFFGENWNKNKIHLLHARYEKHHCCLGWTWWAWWARNDPPTIIGIGLGVKIQRWHDWDDWCDYVPLHYPPVLGSWKLHGFVWWCLPLQLWAEENYYETMTMTMIYNSQLWFADMLCRLWGYEKENNRKNAAYSLLSWYSDS